VHPTDALNLVKLRVTRFRDFLPRMKGRPESLRSERRLSSIIVKAPLRSLLFRIGNYVIPPLLSRERGRSAERRNLVVNQRTSSIKGTLGLAQRLSLELPRYPSSLKSLTQGFSIRPPNYISKGNSEPGRKGYFLESDFQKLVRSSHTDSKRYIPEGKKESKQKNHKERKESDGPGNHQKIN